MRFARAGRSEDLHLLKTRHAWQMNPPTDRESIEGELRDRSHFDTRLEGRGLAAGNAEKEEPIRPDVVDRATAIVRKKWARLLPSRIRGVLVACLQIRAHERINRHVQVLGDPVDVLVAELDVRRLAAVGTVSAIDDLKCLLVQRTSQFIGIKSVAPVLQAAEKLAVLGVMVFGVLPSVFDNRLVVHGVPADLIDTFGHLRMPKGDFRGIAPHIRSVAWYSRSSRYHVQAVLPIGRLARP